MPSPAITKPRLVFVNRFFFPDHSATSQLLSDLAFHLAASGRDVHVVTSRQSYENAKAALPDYEVIRSVHVHRVPSTRFGRAALIGRAIDYASFYQSVWHALDRILRPDDTVIAKTDPPLTSIVALAAAGRRGARLVNWLQDIYPETAVELAVPLMGGPLAASLARLRNRSLRRAAATVVVGELMGRKVETLGAPAARIHVIPNWCDDEAIRPIPAGDNPLRQAWGLSGKFVVGYSGNLGRAHEYETVVAAAEQLRNAPGIVFLMIGGGQRSAGLAAAVAARGLGGSFRFMPYQERDALAYSLAVPDVHWLSLNPRLEGLMVPSKFYGIAAAGRPSIVIGARDGELARLVRQYDCGGVVAPGDAGALVSELSRLAAATDVLVQMGTRARDMLDARFTRAGALGRWRDLLDRLDVTDQPP